MLLDGNTELQMTRSASKYIGWKMLRKSNANLRCVQPLVTGNEAGFKYDHMDVRGSIAGGKIFGKAISRQVMPDGDQNLSGAGGVGSKTHIPCNTFLPILDAMPYLDTSVFKNLRLVVEYEMGGVVSQNQDQSQTTQRPLLIVEEIIDEVQVASMKGKMGSLSYNNVETDRHLVPAVVPTVNDSSNEQPISFHLNGFNNKKVGQCFMWKQSQSSANTGNGTIDYQNGGFDSTGLYKESTQIRVNGVNLFAKSGIDKDNKRLARCVDSWGSGSMPTFGHGIGYKCVDANDRSSDGGVPNSQIGFQDFFGCDLGGTMVNDLQIDFKRTGVFCKLAAGDGGTAGTAASKYNSPYKLIFFAITQKAIVMDGKGGYDVKYV
tara:strand:+ start:7 stop:1134 length:1128 start_codon:yes stop_codon:yes gene_type:complete